MYDRFSPPPSWYEPLDVEDDDIEAEPVEDLAIVAGIVCWHAGAADA